MATPAEIEQLESKYYPAGASLGAPHWADTIVTPHVDGGSYFGAIAALLDTLEGPGDRVYITSWKFDSTTLLVGGQPDMGERLLKLAGDGVDVRLVVAVPRYSLGGAPWDDIDYFRSTAWLPIGPISRVNITSVRLLRDTPRNGAPVLPKRVLVDWGGRFDSRHDKMTIVYRAATQELHAFVGGMDFAPDRLGFPGHNLAPACNYWHDLGVHLQGGAALAVLENFWTRWDETVTLPKRRYWLNGAGQLFNPVVEPKPTDPIPPVAALPGTPEGSYDDVGVRIWRSYAETRATSYLQDDLDLPWDTLPATGVAEVRTGFTAAIRAATRYIYVEDQTLNARWVAAKAWLEHKLLWPEFHAACARGVKVIFVTQGYPGPEGSKIVDATPGLSFEIWTRILTGLTPAQRANFAMFYRKDTKVHSKLLMVDDELVSIGSANLWDRSQLGDESEVTASLVHPGGESSLVAELRVRLWREHLRPPAGGAVDDSTLRDLDISLGYFHEDWGTGLPADVPDAAILPIPLALLPLPAPEPEPVP